MSRHGLCPDPFLIFLNGVEHETDIVQISHSKTLYNDQYTSNTIPGLSSGTSKSMEDLTYTNTNL